jgi:hypothetical protein
MAGTACHVLRAPTQRGLTLALGAIGGLVTASDINDDWLVANGSNEEGYPLIMRMRSSLPTQEIRRRFAHLAIIYLEFEPDEDGLPSPAVAAELQDAEDRLETLIESPGLGVQPNFSGGL